MDSAADTHFRYCRLRRRIRLSVGPVLDSGQSRPKRRTLAHSRDGHAVAPLLNGLRRSVRRCSGTSLRRWRVPRLPLRSRSGTAPLLGVLTAVLAIGPVPVAWPLLWVRLIRRLILCEVGMPPRLRCRRWHRLIRLTGRS